MFQYKFVNIFHLANSEFWGRDKTKLTLNNFDQLGSQSSIAENLLLH